MVVLSGMEGPATESECALLGADAFMVKPVDPRALRAAVTRHIMGEPSSGPGRGAAATATVARRPTRREGPARIVVVEDDEVTAALIRHRLSREGFEVTLYADGSEALAGLSGSDFELVILDAKVPGVDGFELLERLRERTDLEGVPIMMLTGMGSEADVVRGLGLGADDYMLKPFSPTELVARVRRQLGQES